MVVAVGARIATAYGGAALADLGDEGFVFEARHRGGGTVLVVAGQSPRGTNAGLATLLPLIRSGQGGPYVQGPLDRRETPSIAVRGIHLNGWPLNYPYAFRAWKEEDWKRFIDIAWAQRINLFYLWPFMEIIPLPLTPEDEAYLQEVRRVVDYAQNQRGMEVWIMQSANRIGVSDCGSRDPRLRTYWVMGTCQQDMNPGDPEALARAMAHFEALLPHRRQRRRLLLHRLGSGRLAGQPAERPVADLQRREGAARSLQHARQVDEAHRLDVAGVGPASDRRREREARRGFHAGHHPQLRRDARRALGAHRRPVAVPRVREGDVDTREDRVPAIRRDRDGAGVPGHESRSAAGPRRVRHGRALPRPERRDGEQRADDPSASPDLLLFRERVAARVEGPRRARRPPGPRRTTLPGPRGARRACLRAPPRRGSGARSVPSSIPSRH